MDTKLLRQLPGTLYSAVTMELFERLAVHGNRDPSSQWIRDGAVLGSEGDRMNRDVAIPSLRSCLVVRASLRGVAIGEQHDGADRRCAVVPLVLAPGNGVVDGIESEEHCFADCGALAEGRFLLDGSSHRVEPSRRRDGETGSPVERDHADGNSVRDGVEEHAGGVPAGQQLVDLRPVLRAPVRTCKKKKGW